MQQQQLLMPAESAMAYARRIVFEAEESAARVGVMPDGVNRRLETVTATSAMSEARGVLAVLRILYPGDGELEKMWRRLNHCPVIMLAGPERAEEMWRHIQQ